MHAQPSELSHMDRRVRRVCSSLQQHDNICRLLEPRRSCLRHHGRFRLVAARRCVPVYGLLQQRVMTHDNRELHETA